MLKKDLAQALGLSGSMVSRLAGQGMPTDSIAAAKRWRESHLATSRRKEFRAPPVRATRAPADAAVVEAPSSLAQVAALGRVGARLLAGGAGLAAIEGELRQALRAVPLQHRDCLYLDGSEDEVVRFLGGAAPPCDDEPRPPNAVSFPLSVWHVLVADVLAEIRTAEAEMIAAGELPPPDARAPMTDSEVDWMVGFWYCAATGEVQAASVDNIDCHAALAAP